MAVPGRRAAMVGRADELAVLSRLWSADVGAMVLVTGEAGVGKTRLLAELADRVAGGGPPVLEGHAVRAAERTGRWPRR